MEDVNETVLGIHWKVKDNIFGFGIQMNRPAVSRKWVL